MTPYELASRFIGVTELSAAGQDHPAIQWWLTLCDPKPSDVPPDEVAWCAAFVHFVLWVLDLPRAKSLAARANLGIGQPVELGQALIGHDVVVLSRGGGEQPGPEVRQAQGHVGFFAGRDSAGRVLVLGGNQNNRVSIAAYSADRVLGVRRVSEVT